MRFSLQVLQLKLSDDDAVGISPAVRSCNLRTGKCYKHKITGPERLRME
jgi:hypothetical protein